MTGDSGLQRFDASVWDRFFELISPDDKGLSREQIQDELRRAGVDTSRAISKVQEALAAERARHELADAATRRQAAVSKIMRITLSAPANMRTKIRDLINKAVPAEDQLVYFRKLEGAATDEDLRSLLEDIERLDALEDGDNAEP